MAEADLLDTISRYSMITETTDYQSKLEELRRNAVESKDARSFFTHLYSYTEQIVKTHVLYAAAVGVYTVSYLRDNPNAKLGDLFKSRKFIEKDITVSILTKAQRDFRTKTRAHYAWLLLYAFYLTVEYASDPDSYKAKVASENKQTFKVVSEQLSVELANIFDKNSTEGNNVLTRDIYELQLNIFHRNIIEFLGKDRIEILPATGLSAKTSDLSQAYVNKEKIIGKAHLRLNGRFLYVDLPDNRSEVFCAYREGLPPLGLIEYIDKTYKINPDMEFSLADFASNVDGLMYDTMANALRACGFDKNVKPIFFGRAAKGRITFSPTKSINEKELQDILYCAKKNTEKRKSTGSQK